MESSHNTQVPGVLSKPGWDDPRVILQGFREEDEALDSGEVATHAELRDGGRDPLRVDANVGIRGRAISRKAGGAHVLREPPAGIDEDIHLHCLHVLEPLDELLEARTGKVEGGAPGSHAPF